MAVNKNISENIIKQPRYAISFVAIIIGGVLVLFVRDLGFYMRRFFIPSIFVYALATGLLGTFHRLIALWYVKPQEIEETIECNKTIRRWKYSNNEQTIPWLLRGIIYILHIGLFICFILYNFHHCSLFW